MIVIVLMGIVFGIATSTWFSVVESRAVDSATNQVASDLRLAHSAATNRLGTARVIFRNDGGQVDCNGQLASYCLTAPNPDGTTRFIPRHLPPDDRPADQRTRLTSPNLLPDPTAGTIPPGVLPGTTSTVEFYPDGSAGVRGASGTVVGVPDDCPASTPGGTKLKVTSADGSPNHCVTFNTATSRIKID
jgi:Tfp pilus assembly protein FimT